MIYSRTALEPDAVNYEENKKRVLPSEKMFLYKNGSRVLTGYVPEDRF